MEEVWPRINSLHVIRKDLILRILDISWVKEVKGFLVLRMLIERVIKYLDDYILLLPCLQTMSRVFTLFVQNHKAMA